MKNDKKYTGLGSYGPIICTVEENFEVVGPVANWQPISLCFLQRRLVQHHTMHDRMVCSQSTVWKQNRFGNNEFNHENMSV